MRILTGIAGILVATVLLAGAFGAGFNLGAALMLLVDKGLFIPVLVPILLPESWRAWGPIPVRA